MKIENFSLKKRGNSGIKIVSQDTLKKGRMMIPYENSPKLNIPVPYTLRAKIQELTYPFLKLMLIWKDEWSKFLTDDLTNFDTMDDSMSETEANEFLKAKKIFHETYIIGASHTKNGVSIEGLLAVTDTKHKSYKTFVLEENDDAHLFDFVINTLNEIGEEIINFIKDDRLLGENEARQYLLEFNKEESAIESIKEMTSSEAISAAEQLLESKGFLIIPTDDQEAISESIQAKPEIVSSKTIAKDTYKNIEDDNEIETEPKKQENIVDDEF